MAHRARIRTKVRPAAIVFCSRRGTVALLASRKGLELVVQYVHGAPENVIADASRIRQLLVNLVGNAVKYTPDNGSITIGLDEKDGRSWIKVRDTGYGIPAASLPFMDDMEGASSATVDVRVGGAVLFVLPLDRMERV